MRGVNNSKIPAITLVLLIAALAVSLILSALYFVSLFRFVDSSAIYVESDGSFSYAGEPEQEIVSVLVDSAIDQLLVNAFISDFRIRNGGSYPSSQYLEETRSTSGYAFFDSIEFKGAGDDLSATGQPRYGQLHIWPGHGCVDEFGGHGYADYAQAIVRRPGYAGYAYVWLKPLPVWPDFFAGWIPEGLMKAELTIACGEYKPAEADEDI